MWSSASNLRGGCERVSDDITTYKAGEARHFLQSAAELRPRRSLLAPHPEEMEVFGEYTMDCLYFISP